MMTQKNWVVAAVLALLVGFGGYWYGSSAGYQSGYKSGDDAGYKRAEADVKKLDEEAAKKAAAETAKAANPFQVANPLEGVESNPFQKAKKVLNPFE